jgi:hypothetical protein
MLASLKTADIQSSRAQISRKVRVILADACRDSLKFTAQLAIHLSYFTHSKISN